MVISTYFLFNQLYVFFIKSIIKKLAIETIEKTPNFKEVIISTRTTHNQSFNVLGCFILELLGFNFYVYTIFLCSFTEFNKNGTNNLKNTKLSANTFKHLDKP